MGSSGWNHSRQRAAGVAFKDRQDLLGHRSRRITTHYSQAEIAELKRLSKLVNEKRETSLLLRVVGEGIPGPPQKTLWSVRP
jgi:hypothetical protein